jgi:hypothetical protein
MDIAQQPVQIRTSLRSDVAILSAFAALIVIVHFCLGNGYGFHRDELQFLDDARHLQWGFVAYPPLTAFSGRIAIALFGICPRFCACLWPSSTPSRWSSSA